MSSRGIAEDTYSARQISTVDIVHVRTPTTRLSRAPTQRHVAILTFVKYLVAVVVVVPVLYYLGYGLAAGVLATLVGLLAGLAGLMFVNDATCVRHRTGPDDGGAAAHVFDTTGAPLPSGRDRHGARRRVVASPGERRLRGCRSYSSCSSPL